MSIYVDRTIYFTYTTYPEALPRIAAELLAENLYVQSIMIRSTSMLCYCKTKG